MTASEKLNFFQHQFPLLVQKLDPGAAGKWGKMNAQQMVEHVMAFFKVSTGKIKFPLAIPAEHLPKYREFLYSDKPFRENTKAPDSVLGEDPLPLRYNNMQDAVDALQRSADEFVEYFAEDASKTSQHPVFGELNFEEWVMLHYKHVQHHAKQFGLI